MKWNPAEDDIARECERLFQNGGPRVYVQEPTGWGSTLKPTQLSATAALRCAETDQVVLARRKDGQRYVWKQAKGE